MTFDLITGLHMQIQTWHPLLWLCTHAKYYVKSGLTNVLKNANKTKNRHLFSIRIANYTIFIVISKMVEIMLMKAAIKILALKDYINLRSVNFRRCNKKLTG